MSWLGSIGARTDDTLFGSYDEFVPESIPDPGPFLTDHEVLTGPEHTSFHRLTRALFEARTVYDITFDYNLARLNLDTRHPDAGYRYAVEAPGTPASVERTGIDRVLRAEFTPTTAFCPQTETLTLGSFRAWNELSNWHEYDFVRVRVAPMHHRSESINGRLAENECDYLADRDVSSGA